MPVDLRRGARHQAWALGIGLAVALGVLAWILFGRGGPAKPAYIVVDAGTPPSFDYGPKAGLIKSLREIMSRSPCDRSYAIKLGEALNAAGDHHGAARFVDEHLAQCGKYGRILWVKVAAHEDLGQWDKVVEVTSDLVAEKPRDSDFWWWRGRAFQNLGNKERAAVDFRHSVAQDANSYGASGFARLVEKESPCEGAFALRSYLNRATDLADWAEGELMRLYLAGDCDRLNGRGKVVLRPRAGSPLFETRARVAGAEGSFAVIPDVAFMTVTRAFAEKAGLAAGPRQVPVYLADGFADARLGTAAEVVVGKASAREVAVAIVESVPGGRDGILGLSFLWRFTLDHTGEELALVGQ